jgi:hypothetical protein
MDYELLFLKSLLLTISIETVVLCLFFRFVVKLENSSIHRLVITGIIASMTTLPYLWFILSNYIDQRIWYVIIGESFAVLLETIIIGVILRVNLLKSFLSSLTCNMISFLTGLIINWP